MSTVSITLGGVEISSIIEYRSAFFESQANGIVGRCQFRIKDIPQNQAPITGQVIHVSIDGVRAWAGWATKISRVYAFPVQNTVVPSSVTRYFLIDGSDVNLLFQKRFVFNQSTPTLIEGPLYKFTGAPTSDTTALTDLFSTWIDLSGDGIDTSSLVQHIGNINVDQDANPFGAANSWGDAMKSISAVENAIYYIDPDYKLVYTDADTVSAPFALSDHPTGGKVGYRAAEVFYDGSNLMNDVMVWGTAKGSDHWVFNRTQDTASQASHGVWQYAEVREDIYQQSSIDKRATTLVYGSPNNKRGHKDDAISVRCTVKEPGLRVAQKVNFESQVHGYADILPIRHLRLTFANPTTPLYQLDMSFQIDTPYDTHEQFWAPLPPVTIPPIGGVILPNLKVVTTLPGGCDCGITDTFNRTVPTPPSGDFASGYTNVLGPSDAGQPYAARVDLYGVSGYIVATDGSRMHLKQTDLNTASPIYSSSYGGITIFPNSIADQVEWGSGQFDIQLVNNAKNAVFEVDLQYGKFDLFIGPPYAANTGFDMGNKRITLTRYSGGFDRADVPFGSGFWHIKWEDTPDVTRVKAWADGTTEPTSWAVSDSTAVNPGDFNSTVLVVPQTMAYTSFSPFPAWGEQAEFYIDNLDITGVNRCTEFRFDNFNRSVSDGANPVGWGNASSGPTWGISSSGGGMNPTFADAYVDGTTGVLYAGQDSGIGQDITAYITITDGWYAANQWTMTFRAYRDYEQTGTPAGDEKLWFNFGPSTPTGAGALQVVLDFTSGAIDIWDGGGSASATGTFTPFNLAWGTIVIEMNIITGHFRAKAWQEGGADPGWQVEEPDFTVPNWGSPPILPTNLFAIHAQSAGESGGASTGTVQWNFDAIDTDYAGKPCFVTCVSGVVDEFVRTIGSGWGTSTDGHAWTTTGLAVSFSTDGNRGLVVFPNSTSGRQGQANITGTGSEAWVGDSFQLQTLFSFSAVPTRPGGGSPNPQLTYVINLNQTGTGFFSVGGVDVSSEDAYSDIFDANGTTSIPHAFWVAGTGYTLLTTVTNGIAVSEVYVSFMGPGSGYATSGSTPIPGPRNGDLRLDVDFFGNPLASTVYTGAIYDQTCTSVFPGTGSSTETDARCIEKAGNPGSLVYNFAPYIGGTSTLTINGVFQRLNVDYYETDPVNGIITMTNFPDRSDVLNFCANGPINTVQPPGRRLHV